MSESTEQMKRRLEFLVNERKQKYAEIQELGKQGKTTSISGILHALTGDASTSLLHQQQIINRMEDINSQIRRLDFEIDTLKAEISKSEPLTYEQPGFKAGVTFSSRRSCSSCGKDISQFPTDIEHCPYCGSKL